MFSMWVCGWCAGMAVAAFMEGNYTAGIINIGLAVVNGLFAYANWRSKQ